MPDLASRVCRPSPTLSDERADEFGVVIPDDYMDHPFYGAIPVVYAPPLSPYVIASAKRIAEDMLEHWPRLNEDTPQLFRNVRSAMGRHPLGHKDASCLDDESISEGIIRALNVHRGTTR